MKSGFYMTTSNNQLSGWTEKKLQGTSQSQICTKNFKVTVWWYAVCLIHYSFLNPGETITSERYFSKSMRCTKKCNTFSQYWSTDRAQFFSTTTPHHMSHNECFKSWANWAMKFCFICYIHLTSHQLTDYHFFKHLNFLQGKCKWYFHNQKEAENAFQEFIQSWSMDFYAIGINQLISRWQKVSIVMLLILINKDVFDPSYNDLKSTVQNHNYVCTNLILILLFRTIVYRHSIEKSNS